jgi:hypothetical protein
MNRLSKAKLNAGILKIEEIMQNKLMLKLYKNARGAVIGDLYLMNADGDNQPLRRLLATTHSATICAAIFAMDEDKFIFQSEKGEGEFKFPLSLDELCTLVSLLDDQKEAHFISTFIFFSQIDFENPMPGDTQADIHWRTAVHHLPTELVKVAPEEPAPKGFKKELRNRNKYIYFPWE